MVLASLRGRFAPLIQMKVVLLPLEHSPSSPPAPPALPPTSPLLFCALLCSPLLSSPRLSSPLLAFDLLSSPLLALPILSYPPLSSPLLSTRLLSSPLLSSRTPAASSNAIFALVQDFWRSETSRIVSGTIKISQGVSLGYFAPLAILIALYPRTLALPLLDFPSGTGSR